jgi:uncharacterized metal-binding protein
VEEEMSETIQVQVLNKSCSAGDIYARQHLTSEPKAAILSCEGACLKGEVARKGANLLAHTIAPERAVRICHGGALLMSAGGMKELVEAAKKVVVIEGCPMGCGTRLLKAAFPEKRVEVVVANLHYEVDASLFGVNELPDDAIQRHAQTVAEKVAADWAAAAQGRRKQPAPSQSGTCCG